MNNKMTRRFLAAALGTALSISMIFGNGSFNAEAAETTEDSIVVQDASEGETQVSENSNENSTELQGSDSTNEGTESAVTDEIVTPEAEVTNDVPEDKVTDETQPTSEVTEEPSTDANGETPAEPAQNLEEAPENTGEKSENPEPQADTGVPQPEVIVDPTEIGDAANETDKDAQDLYADPDAALEDPEAEEIANEDELTEPKADTAIADPASYPEYIHEETVGGYRLSLYAKEGVFPENTTVSIRLLEAGEASSIEELVKEQLGEDQELYKIVSFDINFYSGDVEIEPKEGTVKVSVQLADDMLDAMSECRADDPEFGSDSSDESLAPAALGAAADSEDAVAIKVFHITDNNSVSTVESVFDGSEIIYDADSFSIYSIVVLNTILEGDILPVIKAAIKDNGSELYLDVSDAALMALLKQDCYLILTNILKYAVENAKPEKPLHVYLPAGEYPITGCLNIYSNTILELADGAKMSREADASIIMNKDGTTGSGFTGSSNITLKGGTWEGNGAKYPGHTLIRFGHITGVVLDGVTINNPNDNHHIEFGGASNVTIKGCKFTNAVDNGNALEALELDVADKDFVDYTADGTTCKNFEITGCTFDSLNRGIGTHRNIGNSWYDNIKVTNNTFTNIKDYAIGPRGWTNSVVSKNTITNAKYGIDVMIPTKGISSPAKFTANTEISDNTIETLDGEYAIRLAGYTTDDGAVYNADGYTLKNNTVRGKAERIIVLKNSAGNVVDGNICYGSGNGTIRGIHLNAVSSSTVTNNTIWNVTKSNGTGIFSEGGSKGNIISDNKVFNSNKFGILIKDSAEETISGNLIYKFSTDGIAVQKSTVNTISDNVIAGSGKDGLLVYQKSTVNKVSNNNISDIKRHGIILTTSGVIKNSNANIIDSKKDSFDVGAGCKAAGFDFSTSLGIDEKVKTKAFGPRKGSVTGTSSKGNVAALSEGSLTGKSKGTAKLKAKTKGAKGVTTVKVGSKPKSVSVSDASVTIGTGEIYAIHPSVNSGAGCSVYTYKSSNKGVAAVTATGVIEAKSAGTATITIKTYNGKKTTMTVTVN